MNPPKGEETIFAEALRLPPEERADYLAHATQGNAELRQRVESLLGSYGTGDFLEHAAAPQLRQTLDVTVPLTEKTGETIGRYKLREQIGEGGCGVVYVADQTEPVRRRVALKIIKLGMDTKSVIARFEAERQALALMDHPHIAKVFDAGATETGRPYFVMELVRGMKITEYCDEKKLSTRERLDLFIQVCQAIQHAHQKGIIHRDIKPSNVLVTVNDGVPVPKVIDFGVAKATSGQQLTDKTIYTAFEQFIGTPAYMSPEQAVLTSLDIDTRSDIYALGVLLYELLTGKTPFDAKELLAIGLDEMRRTLREQEPPRPSTRLSTLPGQELSTTAQRRGLDAPKLVSELRGDLDWIVMKALEKDRARRYETANGLAADIQRHLNNEPVVACPPSKLYRLGKTVRRNRLAFTTTVSVIAALTVGLGISTWRFVKERDALKRAVAAEQAAKEEKDSAEAVLTFVRDKILAAGRPEGMGGGAGKDLTLRQAIDWAESKISKAFTNRPLVEAAVRKTLGESYIYLSEPILAIPQLERALAVRREKLGLENEHTVGTMTKLRQAYQDAGKPFEFVPFYEEAFKLTKAKWGPNHTNTLSVMSDLASSYNDARKFDEAIPLFEELIKLQTAKLGAAHRDALINREKVALAYKETGKIEQAFSMHEEALSLMKTNLGLEHEETLTCMHNLAAAYYDAGRLDRAVSVYKEALQLMKKTKPEHRVTLVTMCNLAVAYRKLGKLDEAISLFQETLKLRIATWGPDHAETLRVMIDLAGTCVAAKRVDEGLRLYEDALKLRTSTLGRDNPLTVKLMNELGFAYGYDNTGKKFNKAIALLEETVGLRKAGLGTDNPDTLVSMDNLARMYAWAGHFDQAVSLLEEVQSKQGLDDPRTLSLMNNIGVRYSLAGKVEQAVPLWEQTFKLAKDRLGPDDTATLLYMRNLAGAYRKAGKLPQLEGMLREQLAQVSSNGLAVRFELGRLLLETAHTDQTHRGKERVSEGEQLLRDFLADARSRYRNDPLKLAERLAEVAEVHYRQDHFAEAAPLYRELVELRRVRHKDVLDATASLARLLSDWAWTERTNIVAAEVTRLTSSRSQSTPTNAATTNQSLDTSAATTPYDRAREAERLLREVLPLRLRDRTNSWRSGDLKSRLGAALVSVAVTDSALDAAARRAKLSEAQSLLLEGQERLESSSAEEKYKRDALQRLVHLYESWNKPDKRAEWQQKLDAFNQAQQSPPAEPLIEDRLDAKAETK
jgi:eukaryotic-like serine/threonine-protein kinase